MKILIMALVITSILAGCGDDAPPGTINEISSSIKKVEQGEAGIKIFIEPGAALRAKDHFQNISMDTYRISENLVKFFPDKVVGEIVYVASVEVADKYGNNSTEPVFELKYKSDDLKKVNFGYIYHRDLLELAEPIKYLSMAGTQVINAWCIEDENNSVAKNFCSKNT